MPGFGPAAEILLFRQKDPKPLTPSSAPPDCADVNHIGGRTNSQGSNKARQNQCVRPQNRTAGVGHSKEERYAIWSVFRS